MDIKYQVTYALSIGMRTNSKGQGHAHFDSEYLGNVSDKVKITIVMKKLVTYGLLIGLYYFDLTDFGDQGQDHVNFYCEYHENGDR